MTKFNDNLSKNIIWNNQFDLNLKNKKCLSIDDFKSLKSAFEDQTASSYQWLIKKIKLIINIIQDEKEFRFENDNFLATNIDELKSWVINHFDDEFFNDCIK